MSFFRLLLFTGLVTALSAQSEENPPRLDGVLRLSVGSFALFSSQARGAHTWAREGDRVGTFVVTEIGASAVTVADSTGKQHSLASRDGQRPDPAADFRLARLWANSDANPMLRHPVPLPASVQEEVGLKLPDSDLQVIADWYARFGWKVSTVIQARRYWDIGFENIYINYRERWLEGRVREFRALLSAEQLSWYEELTRPRTYEEYQREQAWRKTTTEKLKASFDARQRAAYESLHRLGPAVTQEM